MKVVIFAGGLGTRLMEETDARPKPMVEIGGKPILWHILKIYAAHGFNDFIICLGYKQAMIKEYFLNYYFHNSDITIDLENNSTNVHNSTNENFKITLVDTGYSTNTAGRLKHVQKYIGEETFMLTYGDGVSDIDLKELLKNHKAKGKLATLTAIQVPGRFGNIEFDENGLVDKFVEKPIGDGVWINGGFFVLEPGIFKYLEGDMEDVQWERKPLTEIANDGQLNSYKHGGFWKCMDAMRDKVELEEQWSSGKAQWKVW